VWATKNPHFNKPTGVNMKDQAAFPFVAKDKTGMIINAGMSLRDYIAVKAMPVALKTLMHDYTRDDKHWSWEEYIDNGLLAKLSYRMADAMLVARESTEEE
jgi:hypothetical protein